MVAIAEGRLQFRRRGQAWQMEYRRPADHDAYDGSLRMNRLRARVWR
jgi:hypothetical protein